jgi:hypothetical protein
LNTGLVTVDPDATLAVNVAVPEHSMLAGETETVPMVAAVAPLFTFTFTGVEAARQ